MKLWKSIASMLISVVCALQLAVPAAAQENLPLDDAAPSQIRGVQPVIGILGGSSRTEAICTDLQPLSRTAKNNSLETVDATHFHHRLWLPTVTSASGPMCEYLPPLDAILAPEYHSRSVVVRNGTLALAAIGATHARTPIALQHQTVKFTQPSTGIQSLRLVGYMPFEASDYDSVTAQNESPAPPLRIIRALEQLKVLEMVVQDHGNLRLPHWWPFFNQPRYYGSSITPLSRGFTSGVEGMPIGAVVEKTAAGWTV
jgi:hypothetical protein